jgi:hypothetical protein
MIIPIQTWANAFTSSFQGLLDGVVSSLPNVIFAVLIFILGWLVGAALGRIVSQVVQSLRLDVALKNTPLNEGVERAGFSLDSGAFLGALVKWFVIIVFLVASLDVLKLTQVNIFLQEILKYIPQVIVEVARDIVSGSAKAARIRSANFVGSLAKWSIWIFAILAALDQLQIASSFVQTLFTGVVVAVSLAVGLSFGLGGQEAAARYIGRVQSEIDHKD